MHRALLRPLAAVVVSVAGLSQAALPTVAAVVTPPEGSLSQARPTSRAAQPSLRGRQGNYTATVFVAASPQRAWTVLTNHAAMAGVMPDIKQAHVLSRSGNTLELEQIYQAPYTFGRRIRATVAVRETPPRQLRYQLIQGDQIKTLKGSWTLTPVQGGVLLQHQIQIDPAIPGVLRPLYDELFEANLLQSMRILKRLIEAGGPSPATG
jgi:hypothetical protein